MIEFVGLWFAVLQTTIAKGQVKKNKVISSTAYWRGIEFVFLTQCCTVVLMKKHMA